MNHPLPTKRLEFRCWTSDDLALAWALWGDPQVTALIGGPFTAEAVAKRLSTEMSCMQEHGVQYWPIFLRESGEHAGCAGLRPYEVDQRVYELGVHMSQKFWGQGLAVEAGKAVIDYALNSLGAFALFAGHHPKNEMSRKFLLRLGFAYTHDELYPPTGLKHSSYRLMQS